MQEDAKVCHGLYDNFSGMADTTLLHVEIDTSSIHTRIWAAETTNGMNHSDAKIVQPLA